MLWVVELTGNMSNVSGGVLEHPLWKIEAVNGLDSKNLQAISTVHFKAMTKVTGLL